MSLSLLYTLALIGALLFACLKGSAAAQLTGGGYVAAQFAAIAVYPGQWNAPQVGVFLTDLALLGWVTWIITRTTSTWPLALGVLQVLTVLGHCARLTVPELDRMAHFVLTTWTAWPALLAIVAGTILDWRAGRTSPAFSRLAALVGRRTKRRD